MAYASWSVVFGEQPSAAKWNILGTNDASFNDGTGIGTNAIAAASLATDAICLGSITKTSNFTTTSGTDVQVTGVTLSVTIPGGGRKVKLTAHVGEALDTGANGGVGISIWDGTVGSGTLLCTSRFFESSRPASALMSLTTMAVVSPAAGAKTYNMAAREVGGVGTATLNASATQPILLLAEYI